MQRSNLSGELTHELRRRVVAGELVPGSRLNEVHLAAELEVSRTPLREALSALAAEGTLDSIPRRGFFVRPLTVEELRHLYPIRALLDPEALRLAGVPPAARLERLEALNGEILAAGDADAVIELDDAWHLELLAACPNPLLLDLIRQFMARTRRYELAYLKEQSHVIVAVAEHRAIQEALARGDLEAACVGLRENLESGLGPIVAWLEAREGDAA